MAATTNQRSNATGSGGSEVEDGGSDQDDSKPSPVTSSALIGLNPRQEVVQEDATPESGQRASKTNRRGKATVSCSSVEDDVRGRDEQDSKPSPVISGARKGSYQNQEADQEEATPNSGEMAIRTSQGGEAVRDQKDSKPYLVTSSALIGSNSDQEVVHEEATTPGEIPSGWTRVKLEPDC
jgi:hypothetical protein